MPPRLTNEIIEAAIAGFEAQKQRIDTQIAELQGMLTGAPAPQPAEAETHRPKRKFSAKALKRMREAQRKRWAKVRGESAPPAAKTAEPAKPKRKLSRAGRANIIAALKKRWAAKKAAAKKASAKSTPMKAAKRGPSAKKATAPQPTAA